MNEGIRFPLRRNRYFTGKLLTSRDLSIEQQYYRDKLALAHRLLHGAGVVCGLGVTALDETTLSIGSGLALDYLGREIALPAALIRKIEMLDGFESVAGKEMAFLCLDYAESDAEPVNAVDAGNGAQAFNMTEEDHTLFLTGEAPDYQRLLEAEGKTNVNVVYSADDLTIVLSAPETAVGGMEYDIEALVVKSGAIEPISFTLDGVSAVAVSADGYGRLKYSESPEDVRSVFTARFTLRLQNLKDVTADLFPENVELNVEIGDRKYKNFIKLPIRVHLCASEKAKDARDALADSLAARTAGAGLPIYLAKLDLIPVAGKAFISGTTNLPFGQRIDAARVETAGGMAAIHVSSAIRPLEYWQKPDVRTTIGRDGSIHFDFAMPTPEINDYMTAGGVADITMPGGIKVNARYYSDEITHGLGPGDVNIETAVEFRTQAEETALLIGNREVFRNKNIKENIPWAETAVLLYPDRGTMRIGVWMHDNLEGNFIRVHWYAEKPERGMRRTVEAKQIAITIGPEIIRVERRGQAQFKADVIGSEDKGVVWSLKESGSGTLDENGLYTAPETPGTYEIVATARASDQAIASAFAVVE